MSLTPSGCCCDCSSSYRVFVPCNQTDQGTEYLAPAVLLTQLEDSDLEEGIVYLYEGGDCEAYCGEWKCIDTDDKLCRDGDEELSDCPDCHVWITTLESDYRRITSSEIAAGFFSDFTEVEDCCDDTCPTSCGPYGSPIDCATVLDCGCFDAGEYAWSLNFSGSMIQAASRTISYSQNCDPSPFTLQTTASVDILATYAGTRPTVTDCQDDELFIAVKYRINFTTSPWQCGTLIASGNCGGYCVEDDNDSTDYPSNDQFFEGIFVLKVSCNLSPVNVAWANASSEVCQAIPALCGYDPATWTSQTCGNSAPALPIPAVGGNADSGNAQIRRRIGWGGSGVAFQKQNETTFGTQFNCSPAYPSNVVEGRIRWDISLSLTLPNRPDPCG